MSGLYTWNEIISQPKVWQATLERFKGMQTQVERLIAEKGLTQVTAIGCGSTYYLARAAAAVLHYQAAIPARALPSSELWLYGDAPLGRQSVLLAISRSGETSETLRAVERFKRSYGRPVLAVTCTPHSTLAHLADLVLACPDAQEQSVAQTRSFSSMYLLCLALVGQLAPHSDLSAQIVHLPAALSEVIERTGDLPERIGRDMRLQRFFFLGHGALYGLACEGMLKTKEMSLSYAEAFHPLEFRHGPMSMVNEQALVIGLISDGGAEHELAVLRDMQALGGHTLALIDDAAQLGKPGPNYLVEFKSGLGEAARGALGLPILQRIAFHRALANGLDPDHPHNLKAVIEL